MKKKLIIIVVGLLFLNACEKEIISKEKVLNLEEEMRLTEQKKDIILSKEGFLIFRNHHVYDSINNMVDQMTNEEFFAWENELGFVSAYTFILKVHEELDLAKTIDEYEIKKDMYSDKLIFSNDGSIILPFYATGWSRVLNIDGIMKIGKTLFKFDAEKEYMIFDGDKEDVENLAFIINDTSKVRIYDPQNFTASKSAIAGKFVFPNRYNEDRNRRLSSSLQTVINYYTGYGYTTTYYTEMWLEFKLVMLQEAKGLFGGWSPNKTVYRVSNLDLHYEYNEHGPYNNNTAPTGNYEWGDLIVYDNYIGEQQSSAEIKGTCVYQMLDYYDCTHGYHPKTNFYIYNLDIDFWSRGITYANRYQLRGYNNY